MTGLRAIFAFFRQTPLVEYNNAIKNTAFLALFVNTTAVGKVQRYNCGMPFVFLQNKST